MLNTITINAKQMGALEKHYGNGYIFSNEIFYTPAFEELHIVFDIDVTVVDFYFEKKEQGIRIWVSVRNPITGPVPTALCGCGGMLKYEKGSIEPEIDDNACCPVSKRSFCNDLFMLAFKLFLFVQDTALYGSAGKIVKGNICIAKHYQCPCWAVRGHFRHYQNGKKIFVKPYKKGTDARHRIKEREYALQERGAVPYVTTK